MLLGIGTTCSSDTLWPYLTAHQQLSVFGTKITLTPRRGLRHHCPLNSLWLLPSSKFKKLSQDKVWVSCPTYKGHRKNLPSSSSPSSEMKQAILACDTSVNNQGSGDREVTDLWQILLTSSQGGGAGDHLTHMGTNINMQDIFASCLQTGLGCFLIYSLTWKTQFSLQSSISPWESGDPK